MWARFHIERCRSTPGSPAGPPGIASALLEAHVAAVSQHLARLRAAGLVTSRRDGTRIFYRAAHGQVRHLLENAGLLTGYITGLVDPPVARQETAKAAAPAGAVVPLRVTAPGQG